MTEEILQILNRMLWVMQNMENRIQSVETEENVHSSELEEIRSILIDIQDLPHTFKNTA